jgi:hypothetical protein
MRPTLEQWERIAAAVHNYYGDDEYPCLVSGDIVALDAFIAERRAEALKHFATGAEIKEFFIHGWDDNFYHEESEVVLWNDAGEWMLTHDTLYDLSKLGEMVPVTGQPLSAYQSFEDGFLAWKAKKVTT